MVEPVKNAPTGKSKMPVPRKIMVGTTHNSRTLGVITRIVELSVSAWLGYDCASQANTSLRIVERSGLDRSRPSNALQVPRIFPSYSAGMTLLG